MKQILDWDNSYQSGYLETDDDGRPLRIFNASGQGSYSAGGYWEIEDVVFNFHGMRDALLESAGETHFQKVIAYLNNYREAGYLCSPSQREQTLALFSQCRTYEELVRPADLIDERQYHILYEEPATGNARKILFQSNAAFIICVEMDAADQVIRLNIVDGWEAQDLYIEYGLRFSDDQKKQLVTGLVTGQNGMTTLQKLYSPQLIGFHQLGGPFIQPDGLLWAWRILNGGVLTMKLDPDGNIKNAQLHERTEAFWWIRHPLPTVHDS